MTTFKKLLKRSKTITTPEQARELAVDWQNWQANTRMSYGEAASWQDLFAELGERFGLTEEFRENGII
jgi:hypothetical protein